MSALEATLTAAADGASWSAVLELLTTREPVSASGATPEEALDQLRRAALRQVADECRVQGVALTPAGLVASEARVRAACSLALYRLRTPVPVLQIVDPYGTDISTFAGENGDDLDIYFQPISGRRAVAEAVARRWVTPLGSLVYDDSFGADIAGLLNASATRARIGAIEAALQAQAIADERVESAIVSLKTTGEGASLTVAVRAQLVLASGPFALVLTVSQLAAKLEVLRS